MPTLDDGNLDEMKEKFQSGESIATHTVKANETLSDIAQKYYGLLGIRVNTSFPVCIFLGSAS